MTTATYMLLSVAGSVILLAAAPTHAGWGADVGSYHRYHHFYGPHAYCGFYRHRGYRVYPRYRGPLGSYRSDYRTHGPYGRPAPPYSASIEGDLANLYRSGPKVYVHHGADAPVWSEEHVARHRDASQTMLHIVIVSPSGEVSVDRRDLGHVGQWPQGQIQLAVSPGRYTVHLRRADSVYSREVQVYEGMTTIVQAGLR